ncbi:MAG: hypothetical protein JWN76_689 [Chitinophagaceae bacterium]|nr:hypothetical protein [Chitinophagaceae bacterium]
MDKLPDRTLLIVDDEKDVLVFLSMILSKRGFRVTTSHSTDSINELLDTSPELILLDINMPGMQGTEICDLVKHSPGKMNTPVILMSGNYDLEKQAKNCGADAWLAKPFDTSSLVAMIEKLLPRH